MAQPLKLRIEVYDISVRSPSLEGHEIVVSGTPLRPRDTAFGERIRDIFNWLDRHVEGYPQGAAMLTIDHDHLASLIPYLAGWAGGRYALLARRQSEYNDFEVIAVAPRHEAFRDAHDKGRHVALADPIPEAQRFRVRPFAVYPPPATPRDDELARRRSARPGHRR